jgi:hypothetical protein
MPIQTALRGLVPPVVIALIVLIAAWRPWRKDPPSLRVGVAGSALALALAYAVTDTLVAGKGPGFPPTDLHRWLPWLGALASLVVIALPPPAGERFRVYDAVSIAAFTLMRWDQVSSKGSVLYGVLWVGMCTLIAGAVRADATRVAPKGPLVPLVWLVACIGASITYLQSTFAFLSQMAGALAAVMGVLTVLSLWRPNLPLVPGLAPVFAILFIAMTQAGSSYVTVESKVLLMLAAVCPSLAGTPLLSRAPRWVATAASMTLAAGLCIGAVWMSPNSFSFGGY